MTQCYWWWLPRETRAHICDFYNEMVNIERRKKALFAPVLREILVLGLLPSSFLKYIHGRARTHTYNFPANRLVFFRDVYANCPEVREWIRAFTPTVKRKGSLKDEVREIWSWWRWDDPKLTMYNLWTEIYQISKGMVVVYKRKK